MHISNKGFAIASLSCLCFTTTNASSYFSDVSTKASTWIISGAMGYYHLNTMLNNDGDTFLGRMSIEKLFVSKTTNSFGLEVGIQTGNQSRLGMSDTDNNNLGGTSVMTTLKPELDVLLTYHQSLKDGKTSGFGKAGAMYRHMTFDRSTINDLRKINFEVQLGLSRNITENLSFSLGYQGVFSSGLGLETSAVTNTGTVKNIPTQHGALLSLNYYS